MLKRSRRCHQSIKARASRGFAPAVLDELETRAVPAVALGGGFLDAGLVGSYFANPTLSGTPAFTRHDDRIDFDWGTTTAPGGSTSPDFASVGVDNFSARWTGQFIPAFSDTYTFTTVSDAGVRLYVRPTGSTAWTTVIDDWVGHASTVDNGAVTLLAGSNYDIKVEYYETSGMATMKLLWSAPSFSRETIDPIAQVGTNEADRTALYADIVKGARNSWVAVDNAHTTPAMDAQGWPMGDAQYVFEESIGQGLGIDPLMRGKISFSFAGKADVALYGNVDTTSLNYAYDPGSNTTSGSFVTQDEGNVVSCIYFRNSSRDGTAGGPGGITNLQMLRPIAPDSMTDYAPGTVFTTQALAELSKFTVIRQQLIANQQVNWSDRTLPGFFNQAGGTSTSPSLGIGNASNNGPSWEYEVMLANQTGTDLMISIPTIAGGSSPADVGSYISNLANLIRYGSDGVNPYTSPQASPAYPPLNPNLRVYLELGNELWNYSVPYLTDYLNINASVNADAVANNADFQALNYDNLSTATDANGNYLNVAIWHDRWVGLRMAQISDIFRSVFGDSQMMTRIRPLLEWQYNNENNTAQIPLTFLDQYFNNGDGLAHVAVPEPVNYRIWGGGGASYYRLANPDGLTSLLANGSFNTPTVATTYAQNPAGASWSFSGKAGIAKFSPGTDVPPAFQNGQMGYITDRGSITISVTFPANQASNVYALAFKAVDRLKLGASSADRESLHIYLDGKTDITAQTFGQKNGVIAPAYDPNHPWYAQNVPWSWSDYYASNTFTVAAGSTHTITIRGFGDPRNSGAINQTAFLDDVRITGVDALFSSTYPTGGAMSGQTSTALYQSMLNTEESWAAAYGLQLLTYEGGWSLGGNDGGTAIQQAAKFLDPRAAIVEANALKMFQMAGGAVAVQGTYTQVPSWLDPVAQQGLLNPSSWPLIQGVIDRLENLPSAVSNGTPLPASLTPMLSDVSNGMPAATGQFDSPGDWIGWNALQRASNTETLTVNTTGIGGSWELLIDGSVVVWGTSGVPLTASVWLGVGPHSIRVLSTSSVPFGLISVDVQDLGALAPPTLLSAVDSDHAATLTWTPVAGATSYRIRYGFARDTYPSWLDVGNVTSYTMTGLADGKKYYFVVSAVIGNAEGLPSTDIDVVPLALGQVGTLAAWDFDGEPGTDPTAGATVDSSRTIVGPLSRGPGLAADIAAWAQVLSMNHFAAVSNLPGATFGATLKAAIASGQYFQFTVAPAQGETLSLNSLALRAFSGSGQGSIGITYSTGGSTFKTVPPPLGGPGLDPTSPKTTILSGIPALQSTTKAVTFRIYLYGVNPGQLVGLGDLSGDGISLSGSVVNF